MSAAFRATALGVFLAVAGCGGAQANSAPASAPSEAAATSSASSAASANATPVSQTPDITLNDATTAMVHGKLVAFDGVPEGLAWPSLAKSLARGESDRTPVTIAAGRAVPLSSVLRAVWTVRSGEVRLQTPDASGAVRVLVLRAKSEQHAPGCHLAVFAEPDASLRIAAPGGARAIVGDGVNEQLARALELVRTKCPLRYVAFGATSADAVWSAVFDMAIAVDREKSAGDARYVLGEPVHLK